MNTTPDGQGNDVQGTSVGDPIDGGLLDDKPGVADEISGIRNAKRRRISDTDNGSSNESENHLDHQSTGDENPWVRKSFELLQDSTGTYVSDVIPVRSMSEAINITKTIYTISRLSYRRGLLIVSLHDQHLHVVHDCAFSNKTCRCDFIKKTEVRHGVRRRGRSQRRRPFCNQLQISDLQNIFTYFDTAGRRICYKRVGRYLETISPELESMEIGKSEGSGGEGPLETCQEMDDAELRREECDDNETIERDRRARRTISQKKSGKRQTQNEEMLSLLHDNICAPIKGILVMPVWLNHPRFKFMGDGNIDVKNVMRNWERQLCAWTIHDFHTMYARSSCNLIFGAGFNDFNTFYYNVEESLDMLIAILEYQFSHDQEIIVKFVTDLYNVCEKRLPKLNAFCIQSAPNAGKNMLLNCITNYYVNVGTIGNCNKTNLFPFQNCIARRIVFWDEPNYHPDRIEKLKEILGGETCTVQVKHETDNVVFRTPMVLATNTRLSIQCRPDFKTRLVSYNWQTCPLLLNYKKKPNPLCTYELFKHYGLIKDISV